MRPLDARPDAGLARPLAKAHLPEAMTILVVRRERLWCVGGPNGEIGGVFADLASAIRFIRQHAAEARIVVRATDER